MCRSKLIQMQMMDEVINEYTKQFAYVKLKRRPIGDNKNGQNGVAQNGQSAQAQPTTPKPVNNGVKEVQVQTKNANEKPVNSVVKAIQEQMKNNKDNNFEPCLKEEEQAKKIEATFKKEQEKKAEPKPEQVKPVPQETKTDSKPICDKPRVVPKPTAVPTKPSEPTSSTSVAPVIKHTARDNRLNRRISEEMAEIEELMQQTDPNVAPVAGSQEPPEAPKPNPSVQPKLDPLKMIAEAERQLLKAKEKTGLEKPMPAEQKAIVKSAVAPTLQVSPKPVTEPPTKINSTPQINTVPTKVPEAPKPASQAKLDPIKMIAEAEKQLQKAKGKTEVDPPNQTEPKSSSGKENGTSDDAMRPPRKQKVDPVVSPATQEQPEVVMRRSRVPSTEDSTVPSNPYRRSRLGETGDEADNKTQQRRSRFLASSSTDEGDKRKSWRDNFDAEDVEKPSSTRSFDKINVSGIGGRVGYKFGAKKSEEDTKAEPAKPTSGPVSMGVQVGARPGYRDASSQTDPVIVRAKSTCTCTCGQ